jgi:hypothetical protein
MAVLGMEVLKEQFLTLSFCQLSIAPQIVVVDLGSNLVLYHLTDQLIGVGDVADERPSLLWIAEHEENGHQLPTSSFRPSQRAESTLSQVVVAN